MSPEVVVLQQATPLDAGLMASGVAGPPTLTFLESAMTKLGKTTILYQVQALGPLWADGKVRARHHTGGKRPVPPKWPMKATISALSLIGSAEAGGGRVDGSVGGTFDNVRWRKLLAWAADAAAMGFEL